MPIKATFVDYDRIPTRKAFKLVLEVPEEMQGQVFEDLGYPVSGSDIWVAVARIKEPEARVLGEGESYETPDPDSLGGQ